MIAKHVPMRSLGKSDYAELVNYITHAQSKDHRLGQVRVANCEAVFVRDAITEVLATQHTNTRAKGDKTFHLLVSFRAGEHPSAAILKAIEERICVGLGFGEHQRVSAVHHDTDNLHIHIAINKIHPARHTMHEPYYFHRTLAELCTVIERDYGLQPDNHEPRRRGAAGRAADMERHAGVESLVGWIERECLQEIQGAQSWQELHQRLFDNGLELRVRANGFVFRAADGTVVKASTVARDLSKRRLEARLGPFQAPPECNTGVSGKRQYQKNPFQLRIDTTQLYAKYKTDLARLTAARSEALAAARRKKARAIENAKLANRLRRAAIKILDGKGVDRKLLYGQASAALKSSLEVIHKDYAKEKERLYQGFQRRAWADWLKHEAEVGNLDALAALRAREAAQGLKGNTIQGQGEVQSGQTPAVDNITKKGTIIFRAGMSAVRDDGDRLQVSRESTIDGLQAALRLAMQRYGNRITVNGTVEFKAQIIRAAVESKLPITFADPALESRRQSLLNKEKTREQSERTEHRGRTGRGAGGAGQRAATDQHTTRTAAFTGAGVVGRPSVGRGNRSDAGVRATTVIRKPNIGRIGRVPPPQSQHRLRALSQLGVVRIASGSEVLLPGHVPGDLEQQRTQPDYELRRNVSGPGVTSEGALAADKYIAEREEKRAKGFDIPKHSRYTEGDGGLAFAGIRNVDGCPLALLKRDEVLFVLPIDQSTAKRLSRVPIGDAVTVTPLGAVKPSKGRSR